MSCKPSSSKSSNSVASNSSVVSKLRCLKIEENLLLQNLQKCDKTKFKDEFEIFDPDLSNDFRKMLKKLDGSYTVLRNLFDEVKTIANSQELLAELDMEDMKRKVIELEKSLKSFKIYLSSELTSLKTEEKDLIIEMDEMERKEINITKRRIKTSPKNYTQIVSSPVRLLMTSPFKCSEVQQFQEFMKNSPNRYGGWNEYHHNIFAKYWNKYFENTRDPVFDGSDAANLLNENFIEEVLFKLQVITKEDLFIHIQWYKKYLFLKEKQQKAIDKWKSSRGFMRKDLKKQKSNLEDEIASSLHPETEDLSRNNLNQIACDYIQISKQGKHMNETLKKTRYTIHSKINDKQQVLFKRRIGDEEIQRIMKPTKQWLNRNYNDDTNERSMEQLNYIDSMEKLRIPNWRLFL